MNKLRAFILLMGFVLSTAFLIPVQYLAIRTHHALARAIPLYYIRGLCAWLGIRIRIVGQPARENGVLFLANHTSYFDILAISTATKVSFIAKREVGTWPFFGLLAQLQRTVFVDREKRTKTKVSRDEMARRLMKGDNLVLFPEGTSNDGNRVLPFKSALIGVVQDAVKAEMKADQRVQRKGDGKLAQVLPPMVTIQPVSIVYRRVHGVPMGRQYRPYFAWYGDMELLPHLFEALCLGPVDVDIVFHDPIAQDMALDRKAVAQHCQRVIGQGVAAALSSAGQRPVGPAAQSPVARPPLARPPLARPPKVLHPVAAIDTVPPTKPAARPDSGENPAPAF